MLQMVRSAHKTLLAIFEHRSVRISRAVSVVTCSRDIVCSIRATINECIGAVEGYLAHVLDPSGQRLQSALTEMRIAVARPGASLLDDVDFLFKLRPSPLEAMLGSMFSMQPMQQQLSNKRKVTYFPR